jgi:inosine-uridine nucleoside N-ribohydrolase
VPVAIGVPAGLAGGPARPQGRFADEVALDRYRGGVRDDGVAALVECVMTSEEPVTVIAIGPMTNIAAALAVEPAIADRARLVGMLGWLCGLEANHGSARGPMPEYNMVSDAAACRAAFDAGWRTTITAINTCGTVVLRGDRYRTVCAASSMLVKAVLRNYQEWAEAVGELPPEVAAVYGGEPGRMPDW